MDSQFEIAKWEDTLKHNRIVAIGSEDADPLLQESLCIVDAKALFDHLSRESVGPSQDKRTNLEIQVVRQNMNAIGAHVRWVPHTKMIVDGLTKKGACLEAMYDLLATGTYQIVAESQSLQDRVSDAPDLEQHLQADLPEYMIPKVFMKMDQLVLTANGKVDRKALPPPSLGAELRGVFAAVLSKKVSEVPVSASFFALGGHSISVGQLVNRIRRELQLNAAIADIYSSPSVQQLAALLRLRPLPAEAENTVTQAEEQSGTRSFSYPASFQQLSLHRMASVSAAASAALNLAFCGHVRGSLKVCCLQQAFRALCCRHDALRSVFLERDCKILSIAESTLDFRYVEMPGASDSGVMGFELDWLLDQQYETFDLEAGPLCRVRVFQESEENWILHWTLHHVSADLWSYTILLQELEFAYEHYSEHTEHEPAEPEPPPPWPSRAPQYRDYALEEERFLQSDAGRRSRSYWHQKLQKAPPVLDLPGATASERKTTFKGSKLDAGHILTLSSLLK
eukprot:s7411_g1.t1